MPVQSVLPAWLVSSQRGPVAGSPVGMKNANMGLVGSGGISVRSLACSFMQSGWVGGLEVGFPRPLPFPESTVIKVDCSQQLLTCQPVEVGSQGRRAV